jgi:hypothetical protein
LINTHHHIYQNLTRSFAPATKADLFTWLTTLYPVWAGLDEEAVYLSTWIGLAELALGRLHHIERPPLRAPQRRGRPARVPRCSPHRRSACASIRPEAP